MKHLNGVDCADGLCGLVQAGQVGDDILFVGYRHVEAAQIGILLNQFCHILNALKFIVVVVGVDMLITEELVEADH